MTVELEHISSKRGQMVKTQDLTLTVVDERVNKLLKRLEVIAYVDHITRGTPSRKEVREIVAKLYGVPEEVVVVKSILSEYGRGSSKAYVNIYSDADAAKKVEPKYILKRHGM